MVLYTFSGTGNSLAVARYIAASFPEVRIVPIVAAVKDPLHHAPRGVTGIITPVHMNGVPKPVRRFLETVVLSGTEYLFAIATHGGIPGNVGGAINRILARRPSPSAVPPGMSNPHIPSRVPHPPDTPLPAGGSVRTNAPRLLDEFFSVEMVNNTPKGVAPRFLMRMDWAKTITADLVDTMVARVTSELDEIIPSIAARTTGFAEKYRSDRRTRGTLGAPLLWRPPGGRKPKPPFFLDTDACTRCGICSTLCPSSRIVFEPERDPSAYPSWPLDRECYYCYGCFNFCPEQAIGVKHYTVKDGRYHYPGITPEDIAPPPDVSTR